MKKGFTLLETLVAVATFTLLITASVGIFIYITRGASRARTIRQLKQNGNLILERVERSIRDAQQVKRDSDLDCDGSSFSQIYLIDESGEPKVIRCGYNNDLDKNNIEINGIVLNDEEITISTCSFVCSQTDPTSVDFDLSLSLADITQDFSLFVTQRDY